MTEISAELVAQASTAYDSVQIVNGTVYWLEGRPDGRDVLIRWSPSQSAREALPADVNVASHVHEYGGGAYRATHEGIWFCEASSQGIYHQVAGGIPAPVTPQHEDGKTNRYADLRLTHGESLVICVRERHGSDGVLNELVAIPSDGGNITTIASGADFYSSPRPSPDGRWLAWTCWNAPYMPWDATWLFVAELSTDGQLGEPKLVAGGPDESVFQPEWSPAGILHFVSDRSGWWNLYAFRDGNVVPVVREDAEVGVAQWEFGYSTYAFLGEDQIVLIAQNGGGQRLQVLKHGEVHAVDLPYTSIKPYLSGHGSQVAFIASNPTQTPAVILADVDSGQVRRLAGADQTPSGLQVSCRSPSPSPPVMASRLTACTTRPHRLRTARLRSSSRRTRGRRPTRRSVWIGTPSTSPAAATPSRRSTTGAVPATAVPTGKRSRANGGLATLMTVPTPPIISPEWGRQSVAGWRSGAPAPVASPPCGR